MTEFEFNMWRALCSVCLYYVINLLNSGLLDRLRLKTLGLGEETSYATDSALLTPSAVSNRCLQHNNRGNGECKAVEYEGQGSKWTEARGQLHGYLNGMTNAYNSTPLPM